MQTKRHSRNNTVVNTFFVSIMWCLLHIIMHVFFYRFFPAYCRWIFSIVVDCRIIFETRKKCLAQLKFLLLEGNDWKKVNSKTTPAWDCFFYRVGVVSAFFLSISKKMLRNDFFSGSLNTLLTQSIYGSDMSVVAI